MGDRIRPRGGPIGDVSTVDALDHAAVPGHLEAWRETRDVDLTNPAVRALLRAHVDTLRYEIPDDEAVLRVSRALDRVLRAETSADAATALRAAESHLEPIITRVRNGERGLTPPEKPGYGVEE